MRSSITIASGKARLQSIMRCGQQLSDLHVSAKPAREALMSGVRMMNSAATKATIEPPKSDRTLSHLLVSQMVKNGRLVSSTRLKSLAVKREESLYALMEVTPSRHSFTNE